MAIHDELPLTWYGERERGTLEQLTMTPVAPLGLMVGKMIPLPGALTFAEALRHPALLMRTVFLCSDSRQRGSALLVLSPCRFC